MCTYIPPSVDSLPSPHPTPLVNFTSALEKGKLKLFSLRNKTNDEEKINKALEEKAMASHSSTLTWKIPWAEEPGRLQSMGSLGVGHE